ncbi:hypothetical protein M7I_6085 [Glarea lozoyensis 74030]|uniref:Uncharacterized protein n=1 Tax=Glarea lozoyensis (strain ATCC 74030 / MF5533) TaxID=1104152 RepID=H0ETM1_GLAL7|nr:hypothetical protein M7I_6085 [Glarea lozoyensis 74030]
MATRANKRKAHEPFEDPSKKLCVEAPVHTPPKEDNVENEAEDKSDVGDDNSSEGGIGTETPLTPFSPASTPAPFFDWHETPETYRFTQGIRQIQMLRLSRL